MKSKVVKRILIFIGAMAAGIALFGTGVIYGAGNAEPGSSADPLVTKSYLDSRLESAGSVDGRYTKLQLIKGETLTLEAGTELVMYYGNANVMGTPLINLTTGELFRTGNSLVLYSVYLAVEDEAGISAAGDVTLFIKGIYSKE